MKHVFVQTWGCQMNEHDSQRMLELLARDGYTPTGDPRHADLILLNTCAVREKAVQKVRSAVGTFRGLKVENPDLVIGVAGCVAQQEGRRLLDRTPHLDFVLGPDNMVRLAEVVARARSRERVAATEWVPHKAEYPWLDAEPLSGRPTAYVTIMKGCNNVCSFCIVPYVRGRERYRPPEEVVRDVERHVAAGTREVMLLGQNVNSYNSDVEGGVDFPELLRRVDAVPGLWRLRFTTSHPKDFTTRLADAMADLSTVCEYLHLPVQSGSDRVLARMRRGYDRREYLEKIRLVRQRIPEIALSTDIIVGFPDETEEDFAQTLSLLGEVEFDGIFPFEYSPRPHTAALRLAGAVPAPVMRERFARMLEVQREITFARNRAFVGRTVEVLVEGESRDARRGAESGQLTGRTREHKIVNFLGESRLAGRLVPVRVIGAFHNSLRGEIVAPAPRQHGRPDAAACADGGPQ
jgi:tRNA-2-methylthio-N6-dimethylallyladenosine synthase